jgi:hypothetical protein
VVREFLSSGNSAKGSQLAKGQLWGIPYLSKGRRIMARKRTETYNHLFGCYGMPISIQIKVSIHRDVMKEGGQKRYCRQCVAAAKQCMDEQLRRVLKEMGLK